MPLADDGGLVAVFTEELRDGDFCFGKMGQVARTSADEAIDPMAVWHSPGHGCSAGRGANLGR